MLAPPPEGLAPPPTGNPGSAPVKLELIQKYAYVIHCTKENINQTKKYPCK